MAYEDGSRLTELQAMRDYIAHLEYARDRLVETYHTVRDKSHYIATEVWQDEVSERFMDVLEYKQKELYRITDEIERNRELMCKQLEWLERADEAGRSIGR